jgi:hypothetical protein
MSSSTFFEVSYEQLLSGLRTETYSVILFCFYISATPFQFPINPSNFYSYFESQKIFSADSTKLIFIYFIISISINLRWFNGIVSWRRTTNDSLIAANTFEKLFYSLAPFKLLQNYQTKEDYLNQFAYFNLILSYNEIAPFIFYSLAFIPYVQNILDCNAYFHTDDETWRTLRFLTFQADFLNYYFKCLSNLDVIFSCLFKKRAKTLIITRYTLFYYKFDLRHVSIFDTYFDKIIQHMKEVLFVKDLPVGHLTNMRIRLEITFKESIATLNR